MLKSSILYKMNNILYIGLIGYIGAGKDTVAKMLRLLLSKQWKSYEEYSAFYKSVYVNPKRPATYNDPLQTDSSKAICMAFADQLKRICSDMFGVPVEWFYTNKGTAWLAVNTDFSYTETFPGDNIISAEEFYYNNDQIMDEGLKGHIKWMSLREILVYVGTYILQQDINRNIFVNIFKNNIKRLENSNKNLKYVIATDVRFKHEINYIKDNNGIIINIQRPNIDRYDNLAEHMLDDFTDYDYIIRNGGSYDDLLLQIWNLVQNNKEFSNITYGLLTRDPNINNYVRLVESDNNIEKYKICPENGISNIKHDDDAVTGIYLTGGPDIYLGEQLQMGARKITVSRFEYDMITNNYFLYNG